MAKAGDIIEHPVTREKIIFRQTANDTRGELLQVDFMMQPHGFVAAEHIHPVQEERFEILAGKVMLRMNGASREIQAGETAVVPPRSPHVWWNHGDEEVHMLVEVRPALHLETFFETFFGLAQAGKSDKRTGLPDPFRLALMMREFENELYLAQPPLPVQKVLFGLLGSVGRMRGYQGTFAYPR